MKYNWQLPNWPNFSYHIDNIQELSDLFSDKAHHTSGVLRGMPEGVQTETLIDQLVIEAIKTSEIEGEYLSREDVMSSIRNQLGLNRKIEHVSDARARGVAELMLKVRNDFAEPLSEAVLFSWHSTLMQGNSRIESGTWRTHKEPMQVISGSFEKTKIHFEAPPSGAIKKEMEKFIKWFNDTAPNNSKEIKSAPLRSAIAHLYFETIHPFEDGNGRIGRALSEKVLSQGFGRPVFLSLSKAIEKKKQAYYQALEKAQRSNEITPWIEYFVKTLMEAQEDAEALIEFVLKKSRFLDKYKDQFNERQTKVILRMLKEYPGEFEGGMNARKYISLTGTSKATATRDLQQLVEIKALTEIGKGRSTRYEINFGI